MGREGTHVYRKLGILRDQAWWKRRVGKPGLLGLREEEVKDGEVRFLVPEAGPDSAQ